MQRPRQRFLTTLALVLAGALLAISSNSPAFAASNGPAYGSQVAASFSQDSSQRGQTSSIYGVAGMSDTTQISRNTVIARAKSWTNPQIRYSQLKYHDGYRTDCSGYVSMAWHLPVSLNTATLVKSGIMQKIAKNDLQRGDILDNPTGANAHAIIFDSWADSGHTKYNGYEENPYWGGAHFTQGIPYPYWPGYEKGYVPYQYRGIDDGSSNNSDSAASYAGKIVQWNGDTKAQKTAWLVSADLKRYWIPDISTFNCLKNQGHSFAGPISSQLLDHLPDQLGQWAKCGNSQTPQPTATVSVPPTPTPTAASVPTHAPSYYANKIVQWDGDTATQKTSWLVNSELSRYLIPDSSTFDCLKSSGFAFGGAISKTVLDQLPVKNGNSAACGKNALYANQRLFRGSYLRTSDGNYTLKLQNDGNLVLRGSNGAVVWANGKTSDYLVMQGDGNLVTYRFGGTSTWATNTVGTGATKLAVQNGGKLVLYSSSGAAVWDSVHGKL